MSCAARLKSKSSVPPPAGSSPPVLGKSEGLSEVDVLLVGEVPVLVGVVRTGEPGVLVGVALGLGVSVGEAMGVAVTMGVAPGPGVVVGVAVLVGVGEDGTTGVGVGVGVDVGVGVGVLGHRLSSVTKKSWPWPSLKWPVPQS